MLLEVGEENAAVLLARSVLPERSTWTMTSTPWSAFGLDRDQVDEVARLTIGDCRGRRRGHPPQRGEMEKTISRRWADLVDQWMALGDTMAKPELPQGFDFTDPDVYAARLPVEELAELRRAAPVWWNEQPHGAEASATRGTGW